MSVAAKFRFARTFPFCEKDLSTHFSGSSYDYVGNLTRAQVMAFYWNLETFAITTAGTATNGGTTSAVGNVTLNPISASAPFDRGASNGAWYGSITTTAFGSFPAIKPPLSRVCNSYDQTNGGVASLSGDLSTSPGNFFALSFAVSTDPLNAGRYRLYYIFRIDYENEVVPSPVLSFQNPASNSGAVIASGTFAFSGIPMNWEATDFGTAIVYGGVAFSAASNDYTY